MLRGQGRPRPAPSAVKSAHSPLPQPRAGWQELRGALDTKQELMSEEIKHLEKQKALPAPHTKGYSSTYLGMGFANVRVGTW